MSDWKPNGKTKQKFTLDLLEEFYAQLGARVEQKGEEHFIVTTLGGPTVTVTPKKITLGGVSLEDHATYKATTLLIDKAWGKATAGGSIEAQRTAIAYGLAYGVKIEAKDAAKLTEKDQAWIKAKVAQIHAMENKPTPQRPGNQPSNQPQHGPPVVWL